MDLDWSYEKSLHKITGGRCSNVGSFWGIGSGKFVLITVKISGRFRKMPIRVGNKRLRSKSTTEVWLQHLKLFPLFVFVNFVWTAQVSSGHHVIIAASSCGLYVEHIITCDIGTTRTSPHHGDVEMWACGGCRIYFIFFTLPILSCSTLTWKGTCVWFKTTLYVSKFFCHSQNRWSVECATHIHVTNHTINWYFLTCQLKSWHSITNWYKSFSKAYPSIFRTICTRISC